MIRLPIRASPIKTFTKKFLSREKNRTDEITGTIEGDKSEKHISSSVFKKDIKGDHDIHVRFGSN